jgi:hypothetical protein
MARRRTRRRSRSRRSRNRKGGRRSRTRRRKRGGTGVVAALKTALLPFLLYKAQKMSQKRTHKKRRGRKRK